MPATKRKKRNAAQVARRGDVPPDVGRSDAEGGFVRPRKRRPGRVPSYRERSGYGQAIVTLTDSVTKERRDYWLGEYDSRESHEKYHRLLALWEAGDRRLPPDADEPTGKRQRGREAITVVEVISAYWKWAQGYYQPKHCQALHGALKLLRQFYGRTAAESFGPKKLRLLRDEMIRGKGDDRKPWARSYCNAQTSRIRHMFKWAAAREMVPVSIYESLRTLEPLRKGKCDARETSKVRPASEEMIEQVRPFLTKPVRALVELQLLTGARPGELVGLRPCDIERSDKSDSAWTYRPEQHKNAHREHERVIYFGPQAQSVLNPFLTNRDPNAYLFSPRESVAEHRARRLANRKTKLQWGNSEGTNRKETPNRTPQEQFTTGSYNQSVQNACTKAYPPPAHLERRSGETLDDWRQRLESEGLWAELEQWRRDHRFHVNQLRHNAGTRLRREVGLEAAQLVLGHSSARITDAVYAQRDTSKVAGIMQQLG